MSNVAELKAIVCNDTLAPATRRAAADHLMEIVIANVQPPGPDHEEVLKLRKGWRRDTELHRWLADSFARTFPKHVNGFSLQESIQMVHKRLQLRAILSRLAEAGAHTLEKLAACTMLLERYLPKDGIHRRSGYTPERLLAEVKADGDTKWTSTGPLQVERPPKELADCW